MWLGNPKEFTGQLTFLLGAIPGMGGNSDGMGSFRSGISRGDRHGCESTNELMTLGSRVGAVVRALTFHQCVPGSIPRPGIICGLSLLVLYSALRGFSLGTLVFPSLQKPTFDLI